MSSNNAAADLLTVDPPWVHLLDGVPDLAALPPETRVVTLEGSHMRTLEGVFREFVRGFEFPEYFGWNWPAFDECIRDLSWFPANAYLVIIRHGDALLTAEVSELPTFRRLLEAAARYWARAFALGPEWGAGEVPFNFALEGRPPAWV